MSLLREIPQRLCRAGACVALAVAFGWAGLTPWQVARAATWSQRPFSYVALDQDVRDVLREMSASISVPVEVSDAVRGQARGRWEGLDAGRFLDRFAREYGLDWYFDGSVLSVSATSERATRVMPLHGETLATLRDGLAAAGLLDPDTGPGAVLGVGPQPDTALVAGPPRFVSVVQQSIDAAHPAHEDAGRAAPERLTIFHGSQRPVVVTF